MSAGVEQPILIAGLPRSGTTWVAEALSRAPGTRYIHEPDNEKFMPAAWLLKSRLHRYPYLSPADRDESFERLWAAAFAGHGESLQLRALTAFFRRRRDRIEPVIGAKCGFIYTDTSYRRVSERGLRRPFALDDHAVFAGVVSRLLEARGVLHTGQRRIVVKSVHVPLCLEWLAERFSPKVVVVTRNPYAVYASVRRLRMPDSFRNILSQQRLLKDLGRFCPDPEKAVSYSHEYPVAFQAVFMLKALEVQAERHPEWIRLSHDELCADPSSVFRQMYDRLGLEWGESTARWLRGRDRKGGGFKRTRVASDQPVKWKRELSGDELGVIRSLAETVGLELG